MSGQAVSGQPAGTSDLVSLSSRMRTLLTVRIGFALVASGVAVADQDLSSGARRWILVSSAAYVALELVTESIRGHGHGRRLALLAFEVLVDGLYLTWVVYLTGGVLSPLQSLVYVQVIAFSLLASYRTGLKIATWDSLLLLTFAYAGATGALPAAPLFGDAVGLEPTTPARVVVLTILALWSVGVATATLSAMNERVLRRKRADLEALNRMVTELGEHDSADDVPRVLLEGLRDAFDIDRSVVLASPVGDLEPLAWEGIDDPGALPPGRDRVVERALTTRSTQLVRRLDPIHDPRLDATLPHARNLLVVPLFLAGGYRLGVLVVERAGRGDRIHGWTVAIIQQFASRAAVSLHNAWLVEENRKKLEENRRLKDELLGQNLSLEARVIERTQELSESLAQLRDSNVDRERLLSHLVSAQEDERRRIAGDIHDDPLQMLVAVTMRLDLLSKVVDDPERAQDVSESREMLRSVVAKLRNLMFELRPPALEEQGLAAAIRSYVSQWDLEPDVAIQDRFEEEPPLEQRLILYRIAQEAFANIRKHSRAGHVLVTLEPREGAFGVRIVDDGVGFSPGLVAGSRHGHIGLTSMRERAELAGGGCRIHSLPQGGTTVEFWVPRPGAGAHSVQGDTLEVGRAAG